MTAAPCLVVPMLALACVSGGSCDREAPTAVDVSTVTVDFWMPSGARVTRPSQTSVEGAASVGFDVLAVSDLDALIANLRGHYASRGWQERATELASPTWPTSFSGGWRNGAGGVRLEGAPSQVLLWHGEWEQSETLMLYDLMAVQAGPGRSFTVRAHAIHHPPSVTRATRQRAAAFEAQDRE